MAISLINDVNITGLKENQLIDFRLNNIGFVFQDFELLDYLTFLRHVHDVCCSVLWTCDEKLVVSRYVYGLDGRLRYFDLQFEFVLLEVFWESKYATSIVVTSCCHKLVVQAQHQVIQAWVLSWEITLKLLKQCQLASLLSDIEYVDHLIQRSHEKVSSLYETANFCKASTITTIWIVSDHFQIANSE